MALRDDNSSITSNNGEAKVSRKVNLEHLKDISSKNEHIRAHAYQQIASLYLKSDMKQHLRTIKANCVSESTPHILKNILQIAKKYMNNGPGDFEIAEFIVKHEWKRAKPMLQEFLQGQRFSPEGD